MKRPFAVIATWVLLTAAAREATTQRVHSVREYANPNYLYLVKLPQTMRIETTAEPNPNHGFKLALGSETALWVGGSYLLEGSTLEDAEASERAVWDEGWEVVARRSAKLGGLPALEFILDRRTPARRKVVRRHIVFSVRTPPGWGTIVYEVALEGPRETPPYTEGERVFKAVVRGFALTQPN